MPNYKSYPVLSLTRGDLEALGFEVEELSEDDVEAIAADMDNEHLMAAYWLAVEFSAERYGLRKRVVTE